MFGFTKPSQISDDEIGAQLAIGTVERVADRIAAEDEAGALAVFAETYARGYRDALLSSGRDVDEKSVEFGIKKTVTVCMIAFLRGIDKRTPEFMKEMLR